MSRFHAPIAEAIWDMKYRFKEADGTPIDGSVEDSWRRIARALAEVEQEPAKWEAEFYAALEGFAFLPAGRITAGAGTGRTVAGNCCFVRPMSRWRYSRIGKGTGRFSAGDGHIISMQYRLAI